MLPLTWGTKCKKKKMQNRKAEYECSARSNLFKENKVTEVDQLPVYTQTEHVAEGPDPSRLGPFIS